MNVKIERNLGEQPIARIMADHGLSNQSEGETVEQSIPAYRWEARPRLNADVNHGQYEGSQRNTTVGNLE